MEDGLNSSIKTADVSLMISLVPYQCVLSSEELKQAHLTENGLTNLCKKNIFKAFDNVPFGDLNGLLGSVPAEMLHVSGTGLLKHMFGCLDNLIGGPNSKKKIQNHLMIYTIV